MGNTLRKEYKKDNENKKKIYMKFLDTAMQGVRITGYLKGGISTDG